MVDAGADVNAVAKDDSTPLGLCDDGPLADTLRSRGARTTWRRDAEPTQPPPPQKKRTAPLVTAGATTSSTVVEDGHVRPERKLTSKTTKEISAEVARELASLEIDEGFRFDTGMGPDDLVPAIRFGPVDKS